ncbi:MAG: hypothetical protein ACK5MZ_11685 [Aestuariibaculum sp.]
MSRKYKKKCSPKKSLILFAFIWISLSGFSQITSTVVNKSNFENSDFPFKGIRVLAVEYVSTPNEENLYVFSKNERRAEQDTLYIQQFKKTDNKWTVTAEKTIAETGIITSVWNARKAFFDADKDNVADVLFVYSKHPKNNLEEQLDIVLLLVYKNKFYTIGNAGEENYNPEFDYQDFSNENLPEPIIEYIFNYWKKLDK